MKHTNILENVLQTINHYESIGIYIHIPLCIDRCTYCSFTTTNNLSLRKKIIDKICLNILEWGIRLKHPKVDTLYIGGGTPSLLTISELHSITLTITQVFSINNITEATIEANPHSINLQWLIQAKALGWNRISLGVQTLDNKILHELGRLHNTQSAIDSIHIIQQAGFKKINCDLIIGLPKQNLKYVIKNIKELKNLGIKHFSIYILDIDKPCILKTRLKTASVLMPNDTLIANTYKKLQNELPILGLHPYEISSYADHNNISQHNIRYWQRLPYLGIGPNASSHFDPWRWCELNNLNEWLQTNNILKFQQLSALERLAEIPLLGLRMHEGINWKHLINKGKILNLENTVSDWEIKLQPFINKKMITKKNEILQLTPHGMLLSNLIFQIFI